MLPWPHRASWVEGMQSPPENSSPDTACHSIVKRSEICPLFLHFVAQMAVEVLLNHSIQTSFEDRFFPPSKTKSQVRVGVGGRYQ